MHNSIFCEDTAELLLQQISTSPTQCCYFISQNQISAILLHYNIKTDRKTDRPISK